MYIKVKIMLPQSTGPTSKSTRVCLKVRTVLTSSPARSIGPQEGQPRWMCITNVYTFNTQVNRANRNVMHGLFKGMNRGTPGQAWSTVQTGKLKVRIVPWPYIR